jgi:hypothetical protein
MVIGLLAATGCRAAPVVAKPDSPVMAACSNSVPAAPGPVAPATGRVIAMTGTLVDVDSATAYAAAATGNAVDAIDIATGEVIWTSQRGATARLLAERYVWAAGSPEDGCLEWVLIDRESGRTVGTWQIGLPSGVLPTFDERLGHSFGLFARAEHTGIELFWTHQPYHCSGMMGPPRDARREGLIQIDPVTGRVVATETSGNGWPPERFTSPGPDMSGTVTAANGTRVMLEVVGVTWQLVRLDESGARLVERPISDPSRELRWTLTGEVVVTRRLPATAGIPQLELAVYGIDDFENGPFFTQVIDAEMAGEMALVQGHLLGTSGPAWTAWGYANQAPSKTVLWALEVASQADGPSWQRTVAAPVEVVCTAQ